VALGVPACRRASAGSGGRTWADEASGVNDAHWQALGNRLIGLGLWRDQAARSKYAAPMAQAHPFPPRSRAPGPVTGQSGHTKPQSTV